MTNVTHTYSLQWSNPVPRYTRTQWIPQTALSKYTQTRIAPTSNPARFPYEIHLTRESPATDGLPTASTARYRALATRGLRGDTPGRAERGRDGACLCVGRFVEAA